MPYFGDIDNSTPKRYIYTATGGETSVTVDDGAATIQYQPGHVDVYLNGLNLIEGDEFIANGNGITGLSALTSGDKIEVVTYQYKTSGDGLPNVNDVNEWGAAQGIPDGTLANPSLRFTTDTNTGFYKKSSDVLGVAGDLHVNDVPVVTSDTDWRSDAIINGGFMIGQRGIGIGVNSTLSSTQNYHLDRWYTWVAGVNKMGVQQYYDGNTGEWWLRHTSLASTTAGGVHRLSQIIENKECLRFRGQTVLVEYEIRVGGGWDASIRNVIYTGTGNSESSTSLESGAWANQEAERDVTHAVGDLSSWTKVSAEAAIDNDINEMAICFQFADTPPLNAYFDIRNVSIRKPGTPLVKRAYGEELALCQRYYWKSHNWSGGWYTGNVTAGNAYHTGTNFPVEMRATPTMSEVNGATLGFSAPGHFQQVTSKGYNYYRFPTSTANGVYYGMEATADAEL